MPKNYTKEELENGRWVTMKGTHVFIKDGETPQEAIDRTLGKITKALYKPVKRLNKNEISEEDKKRQENIDLMCNKLINQGIKPEYVAHIRNAIEDMHEKFPEVREITSIEVTELGYDTVASMNGLGWLQIGKRAMNRLQNGELDHLFGHYLAGIDFETGIISHELAHNLDMSFSNFIMNSAPNSNSSETMNARNEKWAKVLSIVTGKKITVGEDVKFPSIDTETNFFKIGDQLFSVKSVPDHLSDVVVPMAIKNIQSNYREFGFSSSPTMETLTSQLSGYSKRMLGTSDFNVECFAECYTSNLCDRGSVLANEVMRLTNDTYSQLSKNPRNEYCVFMKKFNEAVQEVNKEV